MIRSALFPAIVTIVLCGCGGDVPTAVPSGTLTGRVTDVVTGSPIAAATVSTRPVTRSAVTDAQGHFVLERVPEGAYVVTAAAATYAPESLTVSVVAGQAATTTLALAPATLSDLTVTTVADALNGDVTSPRALVVRPGPDGVSLREAITAVNNARGPHTISFADSLGGRAILVSNPLPTITGDSITLTGRFGADGAPDVTVDASGIPCCGRAPILLNGSAFHMRRLRFVGTMGGTAFVVRSGQAGGRSAISDVLVEDNLFTNVGVDTASTAISLGFQRTASSPRISHVTIRHNAFHHYVGGGTTLALESGASDGVIENVVITGNSFTQCIWCIELVTLGTRNRIAGVRILRNHFAESTNPVNLNNGWLEGAPTATGNAIDSTIIAENVILRSTNVGILIASGGANTAGNAIRHVDIVNNLIVGRGGPASSTGSGIGMMPGIGGGASNALDDVRIVNNTIVNHSSSAVWLSKPENGNTYSRVILCNSVLWANGGIDVNDTSKVDVRFSLLATPRLDGINGNLSSDPQFVDAAGGNFRLRSGSPAIHAGTADGAPSTDLECRPRVQPHDLGAFSTGAAAPCAAPAPFWP